MSWPDACFGIALCTSIAGNIIGAIIALGIFAFGAYGVYLLVSSFVA